VLHYCEELGLLDEVDPQWTTAESRAEGELALWLASPANMGLAPRSMQVIDRRILSWPGYDEPVECFLIRYDYELANQRIENIGIAGPMSHAFSIPLGPLPLDDVYAVFAGWQATHEEIAELSVDQAESGFPGLVQRLVSRLSSEQLEGLDMHSVSPVFVGRMLGETALVAEGIRDGRHGSLVVDRDQVMWLDLDSGQAPGRNELAWSLYKGRRLLGAFNSPGIWPAEAGATE
jgi:hypothetical protein